VEPFGRLHELRKFALGRLAPVVLLEPRGTGTQAGVDGLAPRREQAHYLSLMPLISWLARGFAPHRMSESLRALAAIQPDPQPVSDGEDRETKIAECDRKLAGHRAALDAGASPATVAAWIAETEAEKATCSLVMPKSKRARTA
jgi:hypothetical protein